MKTKTMYEWGRELLENYQAHETPLNEAGQDIIETLFDDKLKDIPSHDFAMDFYNCDDTALVLIRDTFNAIDEDLVDRQWAYVQDGKLPEFFDGGSRVPKRFHAEINKLTNTKTN